AFSSYDRSRTKYSFSDATEFNGRMGGRPDRTSFKSVRDKSIITSVYNTISVDAANVPIKHVMIDELGRYTSDVNSGLNRCLTLEANIDQAATYFRQDLIWQILNEGVVAVVPVDTKLDPNSTNSFDIRTLRTGKIKAWYPKRVKVELYNEKTGKFEEIVVAKKFTAIIENPFYSTMNAPNSTLQRLLRKISLLDGVDEASSSGKLDLIIQLPYVVKSESRKLQAETRAKDLETQLQSSKYGIAYTDGTEKITQLNRPIENNLMKQIEYLTSQLYTQLGINEEVLAGRANEEQMTRYYNRIIEPLLTAVAEEFKRTFLSKTAITQNHSVEFYRDPFKVIAIGSIADLADKFTRNEILSSNEIRGIVGFAPVQTPEADELRNKNIAPDSYEDPEYSDYEDQPLEEE
ncbi:MAG: phage portal protein, partial [Bacilli bacterium]|nr:phage portal protein [Bacilli bacterium]